MLSQWFINKSQLLHQVGVTNHFILRMHGHTDIRFNDWHLILNCTKEVQFLVSPKLFSICSVEGTGCGNNHPVPKHCAIRPMGNAEEKLHAIVPFALVSDLTLILLTWRIWWAPNNASRWKMGFNSAFKGLNPMWVVVQLCDNWRKKTPTCCHLLFYCTSYRLNMFRALLCPSSGARDYDFRAAGFSLQPRHYSSLTTPNLQHTATQNDTTNVANNITVASSWWWA